MAESNEIFVVFVNVQCLFDDYYTNTPTKKCWGFIYDNVKLIGKQIDVNHTQTNTNYTTKKMNEMKWLQSM